jgi:hypothetical protein
MLKPFQHRQNADKSYDSICLKCFLTAAKAGCEEDLEKLEPEHRCDHAFFADRGVFGDTLMRKIQ